MLLALASEQVDVQPAARRLRHVRHHHLVHLFSARNVLDNTLELGQHRTATLLAILFMKNIHQSKDDTLINECYLDFLCE